jgi:hypothetical protein
MRGYKFQLSESVGEANRACKEVLISRISSYRAIAARRLATKWSGKINFQVETGKRVRGKGKRES